MQSLKFIPPEIDIKVGTTVVWTNEDVVAHTVTHKVKVEDQLFASPLLAPGQNVLLHLRQSREPIPSTACRIRS